MGRGGELKCYIQTYIQTDIHIDRPSDEAGPRGAFAHKNLFVYFRQLVDQQNQDLEELENSLAGSRDSKERTDIC